MRNGATFALSLLPLACLANAPDGRPVLNSFVNRRVATVGDLLSQVRTDGVVADRYERHFSMDRAGVLRYLGTLHRGALAQTRTFTIYSVPQGGRLKMHLGRIHQGEPMFLDASNRPVLVVKCGNPVVLGPSARRGASAFFVKPLDLEAVRTLEPATEVAAVSATATEALLPAIPTELVDSTVVAAATAGGEVASSVPAFASASGGGVSILGSLASSLPLWTAFVGGHRPVGSPTLGPPTTVLPVPEPSVVGVVAIGVAGVLRRRRR